ncbi:MAG: cell division topological specificity factor MinE [Pseudomonadota bacterium]|nr:cell division topological specificity factor MinE [Pseudomonadota bacterium]
MNLFGLLKRRAGTAPVARERLQVLLAHERSARRGADLLTALRADILAVIGKHVAVGPDNVRVKMNRRKAVSLLEIDVELPA